MFYSANGLSPEDEKRRKQAELLAQTDPVANAYDPNRNLLKKKNGKLSGTNLLATLLAGAGDIASRGQTNSLGRVNNVLQDRRGHEIEEQEKLQSQQAQTQANEFFAKQLAQGGQPQQAPSGNGPAMANALQNYSPTGTAAQNPQIAQMYAQALQGTPPINGNAPSPAQGPLGGGGNSSAIDYLSMMNSPHFGNMGSAQQDYISSGATSQRDARLEQSQQASERGRLEQGADRLGLQGEQRELWIANNSEYTKNRSEHYGTNSYAPGTTYQDKQGNYNVADNSLNEAKLAETERHNRASEANQRNKQGTSFSVDPATGAITFSSGGQGGGPNPAMAGATFNKDAQKADADAIKKAQEKATAVERAQSLMSESELILDGGYESGPAAGAKALYGKADAFLGGKLPGETRQDLSSYQRLDAISKDLGIEKLSEVGGNDTERELLTAIQTTVGSEKLPEVNKAIIRQKRAIFDIIAKRPDFMSDWVRKTGSLQNRDQQGRSYRESWGQYQIQEFQKFKAANEQIEQERTPAGNAQDFTAMSDEELKRIAGGG